MSERLGFGLHPSPGDRLSRPSRLDSPVLALRHLQGVAGGGRRPGIGRTAAAARALVDLGRRDATGAVRPIPPIRSPALDERAALRRSPASHARGPRPRERRPVHRRRAPPDPLGIPGAWRANLPARRRHLAAPLGGRPPKGPAQAESDRDPHAAGTRPDRRSSIRRAASPSRGSPARAWTRCGTWRGTGGRCRPMSTPTCSRSWTPSWGRNRPGSGAAAIERPAHDRRAPPDWPVAVTCGTAPPRTMLVMRGNSRHG